ncbi:MAG: hypothetical protein SPF84_10565 [Lachnospiraceae bacterium]|nr:hypothetical protein [Lachnospiraceae bacterium]
MPVRVVCSNVVDYSSVSGSRILPFRFMLDEETSILSPAAGEYQRFCYDVEGVGQDTSQYADLSHFLLGICPQITREDIREVTVVIDGMPQQVVWGENVEIKTEEKPDPPTGCAGLKINFPLDKVDGEMQVCITMQRPYAVGKANVCVFGGNVTATGLSICGPVCGEEEACSSVFYQTETVCVPVRVTPVATPGDAKARCCGSPEVRTETGCSGGSPSCMFTIKQKLCIEIPISFGAVIETGQATVQCGGVSEEGCDCEAASEEAETANDSGTAEGRDSYFFGGRRTRGPER